MVDLRIRISNKNKNKNKNIRTNKRPIYNERVDMSFINKKMNWKQSVLVAAISSALMLAGCAGDDGEDGANGAPGLSGPAGATGPSGPEGAPGTGGGADDGTAAAAFAYTTSGFAIYEDAVFVSDYFGSLPQDGDDISDAIIEAVFDLKDGQTLVLPQGRFNVSKTISIIDKQNITFTGYGIYDTQLDFSGSTASGDAIKFQGGVDLEIRDFSVFEANKNGIKIDKANGVYLAYTAAIWEGELSSDNGAYGLYPVGSQNVLLEHNYSYGSADAGIYVGQTNNIVLRHNVAKNNVAGIEIENSTNADVYENLAIENTGGILVFDLPGLEKAYGSNVRVFNNEMISNNTQSVAPPSSTVGLVPPGTGFLNLATSNVEVYHNYMKNNDTFSMVAVSYFIVDSNFDNYGEKYVPTMLQGWNPNIKMNYFHDNIVERSGANAGGVLLESNFIPGFTIMDGFTGQTPLLAYGLDRTGETMPAVVYDGIGEFVINESDNFAPLVSLLSEEHAKGFADYPAEEGLCLDANIDDNSAASADEYYANGTLDGPQIGTVFPTRVTEMTYGLDAGSGLPVPTFAVGKLHANDLYSCTQPRLPAATVTFRGKKYGCNGDDAASTSCNL